MGNLKTLGRTFARRYETDGVASSGKHKPAKSEFIAFSDAVDATVQAAANSDNPKDPVDCVADGPVTLSGEQTVDGFVTLASRVLATGQADAAENRVWITAVGAWTLAPDMDEPADFVNASFLVRNGTAYAKTRWKSTLDDATGFDVDTSDAFFVQIFDAPEPGADGLTPSASDLINSGKALTQPVGLSTSFVTVDFANRSAIIQDDVTPANTKLGTPEDIGAFTRASDAYTFDENRLLVELDDNGIAYYHDPETGEPLGALFRPANAGTIVPTGDFTNAAWTKTNVTLTAAAGVGPSGATDMYSMMETATTGAHQMSSVKALAAGQSYVVGWFVKPNGRNVVRLQASRTSGPTLVCDYDIVTGQKITLIGGVFLPPKMLPNGIVWIGMAFTADTATNWAYSMALYDGTGVSYAGDVTKGILVWRLMVEAGATNLPMPYPDSTVAIDAYTIPATDMATSETGGTLVVDYYQSGAGATQNCLAALYGSPASKQVAIYTNASDPDRPYVTFSDGSTTKTILARGISNARHKIVVVWDATIAKMFIDGICYGMIKNPPLPGAISNLDIGHINGTESHSGIVRSVKYMPVPSDPAKQVSFSDFPIDITLETVGTSPNRNIYATIGGGRFPLCYHDGDNWNPRLDTNRRAIVWSHRVSGVTSTMVFPLDFELPIDNSLYLSIRPIDFDGQSRGAGNNSLRTTAAQQADVSERRVMMFGTQPRLIGSNGPGLQTEYVALDYLTKLGSLAERDYGASGTTSAWQMAKSLIDKTLIGSSEALVFANIAIGSTTIEQHQAGTPPMANRFRYLGRLAYICARMGLSMKAGATIWRQADANSSDSASAYQAKLEALDASINLGWQEFRTFETDRGHADPGRWSLIIDQFARSTGTTPATNTVSLGQMQAAIASEAAAAGLSTSIIRIATPKFIFQTTYDAWLADPTKGANVGSTDTHLSPQSQSWCGDYDADMLGQIILGHTTANCLRASSASLAGTTVTVTCNTAAPNLTMPIKTNTSLVVNNADSMYGAKNTDSNSRTITSLSVNGSNQIVIGLSGAPGGSALDGTRYIDFAGNPEAIDKQGPVAGARCSISDSATATVTIDGVTLPTEHYMGRCRVFY